MRGPRRAAPPPSFHRLAPADPWPTPPWRECEGSALAAVFLSGLVAAIACGSPRTVLIAAAAFGAEDGGESVESGAGVGMGIEPAAAFGANAAPLAHEQGAAEEVRPDLHAVEAPLVAVGSDADEGGFFREERELDGLRAGCFAPFRHDDPRSVTPFAGGWRENPGFRVDFGRGAADVIQN